MKIQRIALHGVPRSGSTWLGSIFDSHPNVIYRFQPLFSYAFKDQLTPESSKDEIVDFFNRIAESSDDFINQKDAKIQGIVPVFEKGNVEAIVYKEVRHHHILTNMLQKDDEVKIVCLVRDPLSTLFSWLNAPKEFRPDLGWTIEDEWRLAPKKNTKPEEYNGYEKWKEAALLFENLKAKYSDRVFLLEYKELLNNTDKCVRDMFQFMGLEVKAQTETFVKQSKEKQVDDAYGVFKVKTTDNQWESGLNQSIIDYVRKDLSGTILSKYLN